MTNRRTRFLHAASGLALTAGLATGGAATAMAQTQTESGAGFTIEEIVVTAQKREESVQDVPVAMTVLGADQIEATYSNNLENLQFSVPSLSFRKGNTTRNSALFLRGIGTISFSTSAEPSVSTVVDGVVMARSGMAFQDLYSLERVEVLRGPQGTLFGKNASAGALNIITKRPTDEFFGEVTVSGFEDDEYRVNGTLNVPLADNLRARFDTFFGWFDGFITNLHAGGPLNNLNNSEIVEPGDPINTQADEKINGYQRQGFRGKVEWDATPDFRLTLIGDFADSEDDCCAEVIGEPPTDPFTGPAILDALGDAVPMGNETRTVNQNLVTTTLDTNWGISLQADWDLGHHTVTSITAFRKWKNTEIREGDFLPGTLNLIRGPEIGEDGLFTGNTIRKGGQFELHDLGPQEFETIQQELRISSPSGQTLEYQAGLFFFNVESDRNFTRFDRICTESTLDPIATQTVTDADGNVGQDELVPCLEGASTIQAPSATARFTTEFDNFAVFGQATWNISSRLRFTGGLRLTHDEVSFDFLRRNTTGGLTAPGVRAGSFEASNTTDNTELTGQGAIQFDVTSNIMAYAKYARGYKGPAFNTFFNMSETAVPPIAAETADSFEGGFKSTLFDGRLLFNVTGFYAQYNNFQANNFDVVNEVVVTRLTNAGDVETSGLEIDFTAFPMENLRLSGGLAVTDAQIDSFNLPPGSPPDADDRSGERLAFAPEVSASFAADYTMPLMDLPVDLVWHTDYSFTGSQFSGLGANPVTEIDSHSLWNASLGIADKEDKYRLTFIVKNITDESFSTIQTTGGPGGSIRFQIPREADRFFGLSFRARFQ